ncbi:AAA family ATPase [Paracoccus sp. WLY502]|uniref:AAA family ATPase n=1 Tax=Paracoccus yibinensis TaxID=3068891 RepID=UPI00279679A0|nr:AAA family ATPase [Paracoccus sp. WLY502]MDQ1900390.1 AAA family ATPase [Paracoccus sp. WLY502]
MNSFNTAFPRDISSAAVPGQAYLADAHQQVLDEILFRIGGERSVLVLTGEPGTGKARLVEQVGVLCAGRRMVQIGGTGAPLADLHHHLPRAMGIPHSPAFDHPKTGFKALAKACRGNRYLLIVNEAQDLPDKGFAYLTGLVEAAAEIALLLVGPADLEARLARPGLDRLRARIGGRFRLLPLDRDATAAYVSQRLINAPDTSDSGLSFDETGLEQLHLLSAGIPRTIDLVVDRCLAQAQSSGRTYFDRDFVQTCMAPSPPEGAMAHSQAAKAGPSSQVPAIVAAPVPFAVSSRPSVKRTCPPPAVNRSDPPVPAHRRTFRTGLAAMLAGILAVFPGYHTAPGATDSVMAANLLPFPAQARSPLSRRAPLEHPPVAGHLLAEGLALGDTDPERAAQLYARAALWGNGRAAYYLGQLYETGVGVDSDPARARAWYEAATGIDAAADRLAQMGVPLSQAEPASAPVPVLQRLIATGKTELHWQGPAKAGQFRVEYIPAGSNGQVQHLDTALSAVLIPQPVAAWRVMAVYKNGTTSPASAWSQLDPGPR